MNELGFLDGELDDLERTCVDGLSSDAIIDLLGSKGIKLTEATLRKYVQLGLLPRSRRVGRKGGHRGSQGLYPASVIRRIQRLRTMMQKYTIDEIKQGFLVLDGGVEELEACVGRILGQLTVAAKGRNERLAADVCGEELGEARRLARELVDKISGIEARLGNAGAERSASPAAAAASL